MVPELVLVAGFDDGADQWWVSVVELNWWVGLWWVTVMGLGDVVFSGELFGGLIIGFRCVSDSR